MHEFSAVKPLVKQVLKKAREENAEEVTKVWLNIGQLKFVSKESARTAFKTLADGTIAEDAEVIVNITPGRIKCKKCGYEGKIKVPEDVPHSISPTALGCPECNGEIEIEEGESVSVKKFKAK